MKPLTRVNARPRGPDSRWAVSVEIRAGTEAVICRIAGEVDADTAPVAARALSRALDLTRPPQELHADLSGVCFFGAAGLGALLRLREAALDRLVSLVLVAPSRTVRRVLELTDTRPLFTVRAATESPLGPA
jgi:anti-anti-sigma factor